MRGQGMKYAHAISDARQGVEGDLEKSKRQIKRYKESVGKTSQKIIKNMDFSDGCADCSVYQQFQTRPRPTFGGIDITDNKR